MALAAYAPIGFLVALIGGLQLALFVGIVTAGLAMLPDIDMRIPLVKHRGITHTVWFALAVGLLVGLFGVAIGSDGGPLVALGIGAFGFLIGTISTCSHLLADSLTPKGIRPFWPRNDAHYSAHVVKASNPIANCAILVIGGLLCAVAFQIAALLV